MDSNASSLSAAVALHRAGELVQAERIYRELLQADPQHPEVLYLLGSLSYQKGSVGSAILLLRKSIAARPAHAESHNNLGLALGDQGNLDEATDSLRRALELNPGYAEAAYNLGNVLRRQGALGESESALRLAIALDPGYAAAWSSIAMLLRDRGRSDEAMDGCERALALDPTLALAHNLKGAIFWDRGHLAAAADAFDQAVRLAPDSAAFRANLGSALLALGRLPDAESAYQQAIALRPEHPPDWEQLGLVQFHAGKIDPSLASLKRAVELAPDRAEAYMQLGFVLYSIGALDDAERVYLKALDRDPGHLVALQKLAAVSAQLGRIDDSIQRIERLAERDPGNPLWPLQRAAICPAVHEDRSEIDEYRRTLFTSLEICAARADELDLGRVLFADARPSFHLPFHGENDRAIRERFGKLYQPMFPPLGREPECRGSGAAFLVTRGHMKSFVKSIAGLFDHWPTDAIEPTIVCAAGDLPSVQSAIKNPRLRYQLLDTDLLRAAISIRSAGYDIVYFWEVNTDPFNYFLPFHRLAPVQCTSWGIQVTTGIPAMDYYISSQWIEPGGARDHYSEKLVVLETLLAYRRREPMPTARRNRSFFGLDESNRLYLCPQHLGKFHPDFDPVLRAILDQDRAGVLMITHPPIPSAVEQLQRRFSRTLSPHADRVRFLRQQVGDDYLSLVATADVLLDPPHFGGVNTTYDAFSLGKVVVTRPSAYQRGRLTQGCYRRMGVLDPITDSDENYVELALRTANDDAFRRELERRILGASEVLFEARESAAELARFLEWAVRNPISIAS